MSYKTRISLSKDEKTKSSVNLTVLEAKSSVEAVIATENLKQAKLNAALDYHLGAEPFNIDNVLQAKADITKSAARLEGAKEILSSEFAD